MFAVTNEGVIAVDAPPTIGKNYLKAISEVTDKPVKYVVYSHTHTDHIGAANMFPQDATYIAQKETADILAKIKDPRRPVPTVTFTDTYKLKVGGQTLILDYKGNNHQPGNIFIYAPKQKVLMLVDVIFPGWVPFKNLALAQYIPGYVEAHDIALSYDFNTFLGGHLTRRGTRKDVTVAREFVYDLLTTAGQSFQKVDFNAVAQSTGFEDPWKLFDKYLNSVAQACYEVMLPKWKDRLGGTDSFLYDHCWVMMESLRIDFAPPAPPKGEKGERT
jgi:glyoxylase-like metal-dependent hydrolase (beta-lactamase superfamily II)